MNILVIPSWYENNKNKTHGSFFKEQAKSLAEKGHNVYILYVDVIRFNEIDRMITTKKFDYYEDGNLKVYRKKVIKIPKTPEKFVANSVKNGIIELYEKFLEGKVSVDVIHAHSFIWGGYAGVDLNKKYNIPIMVTEHYTGFSRNIFKKSEEEIIKYSMDNVDKIVAVSDGLKNRLKKYTSKNIVVIPNMVDNNIFNINLTEEQKNQNKFTFFAAAYLSEKKGIDVLLKSFKKVIDEDKNCELIIGGDGTERKMLEKLCESLQLQEYVTFLGPLSRNEVAYNMKKCNCFVLPSRHETFGVVYIEALACGKPVIATDTDGIMDIVSEENGIIVNKDDVEDLKNGMLYIKNNKLKYLPENISNTCINKFGVLSVSNKIEENLYSICTNNEDNDKKSIDYKLN